MTVAAALILAAAIAPAPAEPQRASIVASARAQVEILRLEHVSFGAIVDGNERRRPTLPAPRKAGDGRILVEFT